MSKYFIMVSDPDGDGISPIIEELEASQIDKVMLFDEFKDAEKLAEEHAACMAFGYEIFCY